MAEIECPNCGGLEWQFVEDAGDRFRAKCWGCGITHKMWKKL